MSECKEKNIVLRVRKSGRKNDFDDNRQLMCLAKVSSRGAIERALASGVAVHYMKDGKLIKEGPEQKARVLKETEKKPFDLREYLCHG